MIGINITKGTRNILKFKPIKIENEKIKPEIHQFNKITLCMKKQVSWLASQGVLLL